MPFEAMRRRIATGDPSVSCAGAKGCGEDPPEANLRGTSGRKKHAPADTIKQHVHAGLTKDSAPYIIKIKQISRHTVLHIMKNLFIFTNTSAQSKDAARNIKKELEACGFTVSDTFLPETEMILVIGGDGAFLKALEHCGYPSRPFLGINTGHLGFFQELSPYDLDSIIAMCRDGKYVIQPYRLLEAVIQSGEASSRSYALNDFCLRDCGASVVRLKIEVGNNFVETLYGDGLVVASSAGSTAYNYSLRGAIVDPRLEALQLTAMAPINNLVYRSFTSSLLFPPSLDIKVSLEKKDNLNIGIFADGKKIHSGDFDTMQVSLSKRIVNIVRGSDYDFWSKVESKLL